MSMSVLQIGLLSAGFLFLIGGAVLAVIASRVAAAGRAAQTEADIRLAASQELAVEVKRLAEKVEQSLAARDAAIENAFLRHNDACMASVQSTLAAQPAAGCTHMAGTAEPSSSHRSADLADGHVDGEGHDERQMAEDEADKPSFFARLFRRYP